MNTIRALEEIANCRDYEMALMTTFNLDVDFFERFVAGTLYGNGVKKIALFVDAKELNKEINRTWKKSLMMGTRYSVNPVRMPGSFHPKVLLLLSPDRAKLFVASANYTFSGYSTNNEIFDTFEIDSNHIENLSIIKAAADFFEKIYALNYTYKLDDNIIEEMRSMHCLGLNATTSDPDTRLIHNIDKPIIDQLQEIIGKASSVDIAVPFYDNELDAVSRLIKEISLDGVKAYVQNHQSRFNVKKANDIEELSISAFDGFNHPESRSFYHGKVFRFMTESASWILYGSANCTGAALCGTPQMGGNIECCILERGEKEEFDYFYDNVCLSDPEESVECDLLDFSSQEKEEHYYFKYGIALDTTVELAIGVIGAYAEPSVFIDDEELQYTYDPDNKTITITVDDKIIPADSDIFPVRITDASGTYIVKSWIIKPAIIEVNRISETAARELKFNPDIIDDEYYEDLMNIMHILAIYTADKIRKNDIIKTVEHTKEETEDDYEDAPEGIIDYVIPPRIATIDELQEYKNIQKAKQIGRGFFAAYISRSKDSNTPSVGKGKTATTSTGSKGRRNPTSTEERIKRCIKSAVEEMQKEDNLKENTVEEYLEHTCMILDTMSKLSDSLVKGMFDYKLNVDIRCKLLSSLLKLEDGFEEDHIKAMLQMIIEAHYINKRFRKNLASYDEKDIVENIKGINSKFHIRDDIETYITDEAVSLIGDHLEELFFNADMAGKVSGVRPSRGEIMHYLETSFGYKTKDSLYDSIYKRLGEDSTIIVDNDAFTVSSKVRLKEFLRDDELDWLLTDIDNYCVNYEIPATSIVLDLHGVNIPEGANPLVRLKFEKVIGKFIINKTEYRRFGEPQLVEIQGKGYSVSKYKEPEPAVQQTDLAAGDVVYHRSLGEALIVDITESETDKKIRLMFNDGSEKTFTQKLLMKFLVPLPNKEQ